jgi:hypothetical protein
MHPNGEELLRGVLGTLATHVLPEVQTAHAQIQLALVLRLLGIAADEFDGAAQRLVDDNAGLRELAHRGADALAAVGDAAGPDGASLAGELRSLADERDASVRLSDLSAANDRLHGTLGRLGNLAEGSDLPALRELRGAIIACLREEAESRALYMLGPRADG